MIAGMNDRYASIARTLSPICILLDMDGCVVDWDSGFSNTKDSIGINKKRICYC